MSPDPRSRLILLLSFMSLTLTPGGQGLEALAVGLLALLVWVRLEGEPLWPWLGRWAGLASMFAGFFVVVPFAEDGQALDLARRLGIYALRGWMLAAAGLFVSSLSTWSSVLSCLSRLGLPRTLVVLFAIEARHVSTLRDEALRMHRVILTRGGGAGLRGKFREAKVLLMRLVPSALARADRVADALELRCWDGRLLDPGPYRPRGRDWALLALAMLLVLAALGSGVM